MPSAMYLWFASNIELHRVRNIGRLIYCIRCVSKNVFVHVRPLHLYPGEPPTIVQTSGSLESRMTDDPDDGAGIRNDFPTSLFSTPFSILSLSLSSQT